MAIVGDFNVPCLYILNIVCLSCKITNKYFESVEQHGPSLGPLVLCFYCSNITVDIFTDRKYKLENILMVAMSTHKLCIYFTISFIDSLMIYLQNPGNWASGCQGKDGH